MSDQSLEMRVFRCERNLTHLVISILVIGLALANLAWRTWDG